jgi:rhodanese-related sulfurtransferase
MVKSAAELLREANAAVEQVSADEARSLVGNGDVQFVDVRSAEELAAEGKIPGAVHAPRERLEFYADPQSPTHKPELASGKRLVVYCASGARSALAAKTLKDMGIGRAANLLGGFKAWREGGGATER